MTLRKIQDQEKKCTLGRWKAKFEKPLAAYAQQYAEDVRTIKRWIATGKKHSALPPLDQPADMLGWFQHHHKRPAAPRLYELSATTEHPTVSVAPLDLTEITGLTPQQNVENIRRNLAIVERRLRDAIERNDEGDIAIQQRNYKEIAEIWRRAEVSLGEIEKASGASLPRATVEAEIAQSLEMLRLSRERMARDILIDLETTLPHRLQRIWSKLRPLLERSIRKRGNTDEELFRNVHLLNEPGDVNKILNQSIQ